MREVAVACVLVLCYLLYSNRDEEPRDEPVPDAPERLYSASLSPPADPGSLKRAVEGVEASAERFAPPAVPSAAQQALPGRTQRPVFLGCGPVFTENRCDLGPVDPRAYATDHNEALFDLAIRGARENSVEPLWARQSHAQLLTADHRTRRDFYTHMLPNNNVAQHACSNHPQPFMK